ncbi:MAG: hypothetical protein QOH69_1230 [Actinomycetota bacterium]|nr:hypothetical protein [Actinomycetota bacterium]
MAVRTLPNLVTPQFNFTPFFTPVPRPFLRQFRKSHRAWWTPWRQLRTVTGSVLLLVFLGGALLVLLAIAVFLALDPDIAAAGPIAIVVAGIVLAFLGLIGWVFIGVLRRDVRFGPGWKRMARLDEFANLNHMTYEFERRDIHYSGAIFSLGTNALATDLMTVKSGRGIQIGNYRSIAASVADSSRFRGGYVVIELDRRMPHMMAIAKRKRRLGGQSIAPGLLRSQVLSLEGDFDRYFTLYAPRQYERDALYVFTPDLMVLLIDRLASYDLEIVDNRLYIYSHKPFNMLDPATHERLASIVQVVGHKATNQTLNYADDRSAPYSDIVAPGGVRLRRGITAGAIVAVLYFALRVFGSIHGY